MKVTIDNDEDAGNLIVSCPLRSTPGVVRIVEGLVVKCFRQSLEREAGSRLQRTVTRVPSASSAGTGESLGLRVRG